MVAGTDAGIAPIKPHGVVRLRAGPAARDRDGPGRGAAHDDLEAAGGVRARRTARAASPPGYDADILAVDGDPLTDPAALHASAPSTPAASGCVLSLSSDDPVPAGGRFAADDDAPHTTVSTAGCRPTGPPLWGFTSVSEGRPAT